MLCKKCVREKCKILIAVSNLQKKSHTYLPVKGCRRFKKKEGKKLLKKFLAKLDAVLTKFICWILKKVGAGLMRLGDRLNSRGKKEKK
ncbi:hypothetical protein LCGC14_0828980 [marine sediment metagenome]|uniref:Uncharacterized protein n=1 Tax=marine sediment metagenome TaxID=412755 RepID=A0A0F9PGJ6_9ZZZZ